MAATSLGKWAFTLTLGVYAYREGGTLAIGIVALLQAIPATIAAPLLGLAADRYPRQRVLLITSLARATALALIALAVLDGLQPAIVFALAACFATVSTANQPARAALIPVLSRSPSEVAAATALMGAIDTAGFLVGAGFGGILLAQTSVQFVVAACCAAYLLSAALVLAIPVDTRPSHRRGEGPLAQLAAGVRTVAGDHSLRNVMSVMGVLSIVDGLVSVLVIVAAIRLLHIGTAGVGYLNIARGAGGMLGGSVALSLLGRSRLTAALAIGTITLGAPLIALGLFPHPALGVAAWAGVGAGYVLVKVSGLTLVQRLSGDRVLARVLGLLETTFVASLGLGAILAPALISILGIRGTLIAAGAVLPLSAALRWRTLQGLELGAPVPRREFGMLRGCPVLAPLPIATLEGLARRLAEIDVPAGAEIVRQGDPGERFYLIESGRVEVHVDGELRRELGRGDSFGEIALLRDVPRTATVRAVEETRLLALERDPFLISVTGHADSHEAASDVVERLLSPAATASG